jgi:hypothetical protein
MHTFSVGDRVKGWLPIGGRGMAEGIIIRVGQKRLIIEGGASILKANAELLTDPGSKINSNTEPNLN